MYLQADWTPNNKMIKRRPQCMKNREYFYLNTWIINSAINTFHLPIELYFSKRMNMAVSLVTDRERGSKMSTVPVVWTTFGIISARSKLFPVAIGDHGRKPGYITMTRRQSNNQWSGVMVAHNAPKNSECKIPLEKFSPRFFGIKTASHHWLSSKWQNY